MNKTSMPHESLGPGKSHYDGFVECLRVIKDLLDPCWEDTSACSQCADKIKSYGFTPESWMGYREFMRRYDPNLNYAKIMQQISEVMPIWSKTENKLLGYFNRKTQKWIDKSTPEPLTANWIKNNCKFSKLIS